MFKTDSFLGNKKLSLNQNVWRDHATMQQDVLLHFVAFFHVASLFSIGVDNEKALELDNRIFFFIFQPDFNVEISPQKQNILLHSGMITPNILVQTQFSVA